MASLEILRRELWRRSRGWKKISGSSGELAAETAGEEDAKVTVGVEVGGEDGESLWGVRGLGLLGAVADLVSDVEEEHVAGVEGGGPAEDEIVLVVVGAHTEGDQV